MTPAEPLLALAQKQNKTDHFPGSPLQNPSITPIRPEGTLHASQMATLAKGVILHVSKTTEQGISWPDITTEQV